MNNWLKTCNISGWITINHQPEPMSFLGRLPLLSMIHCCVLIHLHTPTQHEKSWAALQNHDDAYHPNEFCISDLSWRIFGLIHTDLGRTPTCWNMTLSSVRFRAAVRQRHWSTASVATGSTQTARCSWDLVGQNCSNKSLWLMPLWGFGKSSKGYTVDSTHSYKLTLILIDNKIQCHAI